MTEPDPHTEAAGEDLSDEEMAEQVQAQTSSLREADLDPDERAGD
jgi:hypothetical protein